MGNRLGLPRLIDHVNEGLACYLGVPIDTALRDQWFRG